MPFIVTTKRPDPLADEAHAPLSGPRDPATARAPSTVSRRAVATVEEARAELRRGPLCDLAAAQQYEAMLLLAEQIDALSESGGTVGPLSDGTAIEVAPVTRQYLWLNLPAPADRPAGYPPERLAQDDEALCDAFNAREAAAR